MEQDMEFSPESELCRVPVFGSFIAESPTRPFSQSLSEQLRPQFGARKKEMHAKEKPQEWLISDVRSIPETLAEIPSADFVVPVACVIKVEKDLEEEPDTWPITADVCASASNIQKQFKEPVDESSYNEQSEPPFGTHIEEMHAKEEPREWLISDIQSIADSLSERPSTDFVVPVACVIKVEKDLKEEPDTWPITADVCASASNIQKQFKEPVDESSYNEQSEPPFGTHIEEMHAKEEPREWLISDIQSIADSLSERPSTDFVVPVACVIKVEKDLKEEPDTWPITADVCASASNIQKQFKEPVDESSYNEQSEPPFGTHNKEMQEMHAKEEPREWLISDIQSIADPLSERPSTEFMVPVACVIKVEKDLKEEPNTWSFTAGVCASAVDIQQQFKEEPEDEPSYNMPYGEQSPKKESDYWSESDHKPLKEGPETWPIKADVCTSAADLQMHFKVEQKNVSPYNKPCPEQPLKPEEENSICQTENKKRPRTPRSKSNHRKSRHKTSKKKSRPPPPQLEQFKCEICDKFIKHLPNFIEHQRIHTGERPYKCKVCKKTFTRGADLTKHGLVHSNRRPHKCKTCGKKFKLAGDLSKHSLVHSDLFPFKCNTCEKSFKRTACLIKHMRIHTEEKPFPCSVCNKRFKWEASVREHERIHSGEKPFKCPECNKRFTHFSTFIQHKRTHGEDDAFSCDVCNKSFNHKSNLLQHQRNMHS